MWREALRNKRVTFWSDNESVVQVINRQTAKRPHLLALIRQMVLTYLQYNIVIRAKHKASRNFLADVLSRLQVAKFRELAQGMDPEASLIPQHLPPQNWGPS